MSDLKLKHISLTKLRGTAYKTLFGGKPDKLFPFHTFNEENDAYLIDVFIYPLNLEEFPGRVVAAVTNGMSDEHAERLYDLAWMPLFDRFSLAEYQTIEMPDAVVPNSPLKNAFFLPPLLKPHQCFRVDIEGMPVRFLWHVPISDVELHYKKDRDANSLIQRMQAVELPWIFDEAERPPLVE